MNRRTSERTTDWISERVSEWVFWVLLLAPERMSFKSWRFGCVFRQKFRAENIISTLEICKHLRFWYSFFLSRSSFFIKLILPYISVDWSVQCNHIYNNCLSCFRHCANALNNCHQSVERARKKHFYHLKKWERRSENGIENHIVNATEISGSFTVFVTISLNAVIPIRNVLCYFFGCFGLSHSVSLLIHFFPRCQSRKAEKSHISFFLFAVCGLLFSQASKWKHRKIMSFP